MEKVLFGVLLFGLIMLFVFVLNYITQQVDMDKIPRQKKNKYYTWFWYFYSIFFLLYGLKNILINEMQITQSPSLKIGYRKCAFS